MLAKLIKGDINKRDRQESGFTIVEVMIVLAIAGLILAIVFIAVPALQRNARDTQRRGDIGAIQGAIATYSGNNNGAIPTSNTEMTTALTGIGLNFYDATVASGSAPAAKTLSVSGALAPRTGAVTSPAALTAGQPEVFTDGAVYVPEAECTTTTASKTASTLTVGYGGVLEYGSVRSYAVVYALESDPDLVCVDNI